MTNKKFFFSILMMAVLPFSSTKTNAVIVEVPLSIDDPTTGNPNPHRGPILVPEVSIDGYTLYFGTSCDGYTLSIVNEDGNVEYSTVIPASSTSIILPSWLSGEYEIRLYPTDSNIYFYGWIELQA